MEQGGCGYPANPNDIELRMEQGFSVFVVNWGGGRLASRLSTWDGERQVFEASAFGIAARSGQTRTEISA